MLSADRSIAHLDAINVHLTFDRGADDVMRVLDIEYARWLDYTNLEDIRELIVRMISSGKLRGVYVVRKSRLTSMPNGGTRTIEYDEYWLTQTQALLVATQAKGKRAWAITEAIVEVFVAVMTQGQPAKIEDGAISWNRPLLGSEWHQLIRVPLHRLADRLIAKFGGERAAHFNSLLGTLADRLSYRGAWEHYPYSPERISELARQLRRLDQSVCDRTRGLPDIAQADALFGRRAKRRSAA